ncbi:hypothetical protein PUN28_011905 [Cardiocondyla obscurior]|uniref:Uncharacterized protein n=1 Tax=Cardiocondyla obscurior TaxID=286306 RepID=A0AAW2FKI3_9HYME
MSLKIQICLILCERTEFFSWEVQLINRYLTMAGGEGMEAVESLKRYWTFHPIPQYILAKSTNNEKLTGEVHNNQTDPQPGSSGINTFFSTEKIFRGRECTTSFRIFLPNNNSKSITLILI